MVRLKIPTGRRQTSIYKRGRGVEFRTTKNNNSLVVIARLAPATTGFQVRSPDNSARISPPTEFPFPATLESSFAFQSSLHSPSSAFSIPIYPYPFTLFSSPFLTQSQLTFCTSCAFSEHDIGKPLGMKSPLL